MIPLCHCGETLLHVGQHLTMWGHVVGEVIIVCRERTGLASSSLEFVSCNCDQCIDIFGLGILKLLEFEEM